MQAFAVGSSGAQDWHTAACIPHVYLQIGAGILHAQPVAEPESPLGELSMAKFPFFIDEVINPDVFTIESWHWEVELSPMNLTGSHK